MNPAHVGTGKSLKIAVVIDESMWVLKAWKIDRWFLRAAYQTQTEGAANMSKGKDTKKQDKKKPQKSLMEKRAEKRAKKGNAR